MSEVALAEWNRFLETAPDAHVLQTGEWGELKSAFGWNVARYLVDGLGTQVLFRRLPFGLSFGYIPKGPIGKVTDRAMRQLVGEIDVACRRRYAVFLKIEADAWDDDAERLDPFRGGDKPLELGLRASNHSIQPRRTIIVDLRDSEDEILRRMKPKCRYNIGLARRKGVAVEPWDDLRSFHAMMQATGRRDGFAVHSLEYVQRAYELFKTPGAAELLVARYEGRALAALMVFRRGRRAWYLYGASMDEGRELMPNYLLQWEAMRWARRCGSDEYDLWGVPDRDEDLLENGFESRHDGLWGVYRFKRGFGGQVRRAVQAQDRVYLPAFYMLYQLLAAGRSMP